APRRVVNKVADDAARGRSRTVFMVPAFLERHGRRWTSGPIHFPAHARADLSERLRGAHFPSHLFSSRNLVVRTHTVAGLRERLTASETIRRTDRHDSVIGFPGM